MVDTRGIAVVGSLAALLLGTVLTAGAVGAETSSWAGRVDPAGQAPKKAPVKAAPETVVKSVPLTSEGGQVPLLKPPSVPSGKGKPPATNEPDPAYEAFEQGRYLTALELAMKAAERGEPQAFTLVGRIYSEGLGVGIKAALAAQWFGRAAELGDPEGMFAYGMLLTHGRGVEKDRVKAGKLFEQAAERKHLLANYNLALLFLRGDGKPENPHRALLHMQYAAKHGVVTAQYDLGTMYATGTGTDPNAFEAARWIGKAAAAGHPEAQVDYAVMLFRGHGVPVDANRGADYFKRAAEKGLATAQNRLARCYTHGAGVVQDLVEAAKWNYIAKAGGVVDEGLDAVLDKQLSRTDHAKAQQAALLWHDRIAVGLD